MIMTIHTTMTIETEQHLAKLDPRLNAAAEIVREAARFILERHTQRKVRPLGIQVKGRNDLVTEVDKGSESIISEGLKKIFPEIPFLGEEFGIRPGEILSKEPYWILDPIDGTTNFSHGFPLFSVSLALVENGKPVIGLVVEIIRDEWFYAVSGKGSFLNGKPVKVADVPFSQTLIGTGFPIADFSHLKEFQQVLGEIIQQNHGARRAGSAATDLAYTASGRFNGFFELGLKPWDMAAGILLVQEAGGIVTDYFGGNQMLETGHLISGAPAVHRKLFEIISRHYESFLKTNTGRI
ncbi:MAG: inositol monophosphatase [Bacteroidetes bacterium]|nr:inositol monophosphatase [Bacteroidota bacterium]